MMNPWLTLGTVAFVASFGISLLMTRDLGGAIVAGSLALATGFVTAAAVNSYHKRSADQRLGALKHQIRLLQRRRAEEEQAVVEITAEKERVLLSLNSMQDELRQRQLPGAEPFARPMLSWDLSSQPELRHLATSDRPPHLHADIQPELHPAALTQFVAEAAATKQKITASLNHLQTELSQVNAQVSQQQHDRDQLMQEVKYLAQQKQTLTTAAQNLQVEVEDLERCRAELDQYISYVETKKQELESGANPLQKALKQLQSQINALQQELEQLEAQVTAKRQEKAELEREAAGSKLHKNQASLLQASIQQLEAQKSQLEQAVATLQPQQKQISALQATVQALENQRLQLERDITNLQAQQERSRVLQEQMRQLESQKATLERDLTGLKSQAGQVKSVQDSLQKLEKQLADRKKEKESLERQIAQLQAQKTALRQLPPPIAPAQSEAVAASQVQNGNSKPKTIPRPIVRVELEAEPEPIDSSTQELSDLWTNFMVQLPEYELAALKAIAHEANPSRIINRIAEDNFTTVDELIDSINQRAEETVGEAVIKARPGAAAAIVRDHQRTIKKLIETYEYLTE